MLVKTKGIIAYFVIVAVAFLFSCKNNGSYKPSTSPSADDFDPYGPPIYRYPGGGKRRVVPYYNLRRDNDQYYVPLRKPDDNFDDNRDRLYR